MLATEVTQTLKLLKMDLKSEWFVPILLHSAAVNDNSIKNLIDKNHCAIRQISGIPILCCVYLTYSIKIYFDSK